MIDAGVVVGATTCSEQAIGTSVDFTYDFILICCTSVLCAILPTLRRNLAKANDTLTVGIDYQWVLIIKLII